MLHSPRTRHLLFWGFFGLIVVLCGAFFLEITALRNAYGAAHFAPDGYYRTTPDADLSVAEFLSYNCSYCKEAHPILEEAIRRDGRITYVPKPILMNDPPAVLAARAAYGAGYQGKFMDMHDALLKNTGPIDEALIRDIALSLGLDADRLQQDMQNQEITDVLNENTNSFVIFKGIGTPSFLIGNRIFYMPEGRMPTADEFLLLFEEARNF